MDNKIIDYEQLYYDSLYEIKILNKKIEELELEIGYLKSSNKEKKLRKYIINELKMYQKRRIYEDTNK
jgi:hypothetical protein